MKIKATINMICPKEEGISKATGNKWQSQELVLEMAETIDGKEVRSTIATRTMNQQIIETLSKAMEGDEVEADLGCQARARSFIRKDGTEAIIRSTEVFLRSLTVTKEGGF